VLGRTLNLGILAHVDAGKTTLTERLLHAAGVIDEPGSVDRGTTQTDTLALERQRGITIKAAVVSFALGDLTVNLVDTPGHPDFIAEVERVLGVLDGAVLVLSAVEGVQPQTVVLHRALERLGIPTLFFVNKTDRMGADVARVTEAIRDRLTHGEPPLPVFSGSAMTGDGIPTLIAGIAEHLPSAAGDPQAPVAASVFKVDRARNGEKVAYVRVFDGTIRVRDRVHDDEKATAIEVFADGGVVQRRSVIAGEIAKLRGLRTVRIGDRIGEGRLAAHQFAPPTLETVVEATDQGRLKAALLQLAEQDPLIAVRQSELNQELSVSIYGEVQKEVVEATLAADFGLDVTFRETTPICVERPAGFGEAAEVLHAETNPYNATIGLRVEPAPVDSGIAFRYDVVHSDVPLYLYGRIESFAEYMEEYVRESLAVGLHGWRVTDCIVTLVQCAYSIADGPPSRRGPTSTAADFRKLTPLVLAQALARAGTLVCEPVLAVRIELPADSIGAVLASVARAGGAIGTTSLDAIEAVVPATRLREVQLELPGLTHGLGVLESSFAGYRPAVRAVPG
jgi:ribosomal protection tetracycline resistance protein